MPSRKIPTEQLTRLGKRIKELRIQKGYSSAELFAYDHKFDRSVWWRYERGEDLRFSSLSRVAAAFGMSLEEFFSQGFD